MRLNEGELLSHYRFTSSPSRPFSCGRRTGVVTGVLEEVGCEECRLVAVRAEKLANVCGCRSAETHEGTARWQIEGEGGLS